MSAVSVVRVEFGRAYKNMIGKVYQVIGETPRSFRILVGNTPTLVLKDNCSIVLDTEGYVHNADVSVRYFGVPSDEAQKLYDLLQSDGSGTDVQPELEWHVGKEASKEAENWASKEAGEESGKEDGNGVDASASDGASDGGDNGGSDDKASKTLYPLLALLPSYISGASVVVEVIRFDALRWHVFATIHADELSQFKVSCPVVISEDASSCFVVDETTNKLVPNFVRKALHSYVVSVVGPDALHAIPERYVDVSKECWVSREVDNTEELDYSCKSVRDFFSTISDKELAGLSVEQKKAAYVLIENFRLFAED